MDSHRSNIKSTYNPNTQANSRSSPILSSVEKIDVEELIKDFKIVDINNFSAYLKELWEDLKQRSDNKTLGVNKMTFMRYFSLPGLIAERLFSVFDVNHNEYLDLSEFLEGMMTLYTESYDKLAKFIFRFYDFDKDGLISREDIRTVLSYIPIRNGNHSVMKKFKLKFEKEDFKDRVESQDELHDLLDKCFKNSQVLDYHGYLKVLENISSDIFLFILIFLLEKKPFSKKALQAYEGQRKYNTLFKQNKTPNPKLKSKFMVASPNLNSKFSPSVTIKKSPFWHTRNLSGNGGLPLGGSNNQPSSFENNLALLIPKENGSKTKHADFLNKFVRPSGHPNLASKDVVINNNTPSRFAKPEVRHSHTRVNSAFSLTSNNIFSGNVMKPKTIIIDDNCEMKPEDSLKMSIEKLNINDIQINKLGSKKNSMVNLNQQIANGSNEENANMSSNPKDENIIYLSNQSNEYQENILSTISEEYLTFNPIPGNCDSTGNLNLEEDGEIKNVPVFNKHKNNLKGFEEPDENGSSNNLSHNNKTDKVHAPLKDYSDLKILPAVKYKTSSLSSNMPKNTSTSMKNSLLNGEKVNVGNSVKFSFNAIQDESDEEPEDEVNHEGFLYKISRGKKLKKRYYKLIHKDLYSYRNKGDSSHKGLHNLAGVFILEGQPLQFNEFYFYTFTMIFFNKSRVYYSDNEKEYREWIENIKLATGYSNLTDFYDVKEKLGNGKFGLVRMGFHKGTGRKVAVKIMYKGDMTISDLELVKTEIEILKVCQHPNIIRLYDVYENAEYIYIIMEYCPGGDLFSYLEHRQFKLKESKVAQIIHKLSTAIYYLHSYGVTHRDLKPENILMTDNSDEADIRIVDFGLSKIIGPQETCNEPFGTLSYVAPEVLLEMPYDKSVDMWSLGIITYLLLTGCLPFDDEHSEREVARKTIHEPVPFPVFFWKNISLDARDFVTHLLQKDPRRRMTIKQVLEHSWIQKFNKTVLPEIRKKCKDLLYSTFKIYSTTEDINK